MNVPQRLTSSGSSFTTDETEIMVYTDKMIQICDINSFTLGRSIPLQNCGLIFRPTFNTTRTLFAGYNNNTIFVWDTDSGELKDTITTNLRVRDLNFGEGQTICAFGTGEHSSSLCSFGLTGTNMKIIAEAARKDLLLLKEHGENFIPGQALSQSRVRNTILDYAYGKKDREQQFWDELKKTYIPRQALDRPSNQDDKDEKTKGGKKTRKYKNRRTRKTRKTRRTKRTRRRTSKK
jgi:hypothetical protein